KERKKERKMATYTRSDSCRVCPSARANRFDTARRKRASPDIFAHVSEDALARLFRKAGDAVAEERARSIFACASDPDETARALMALKQRKKDKFLRIARTLRGMLRLR
ncbi:thyroid cancer-1, partial [Silurus meridionalis]